ncbi:hypothetical protein ASG87_18940 [Frateuria sp. Soil773]|uniref:hypothetical protein n=1 Tax=Frateuria sp. Soil773 TaxID=1736407 RepID=UPI0006FD342C|nr:hypothetical protein [Frateuria sp. Soil773]KRE90081.1 hypothetical protein ASG87_18940 [Frateuria sp. Soil773]
MNIENLKQAWNASVAAAPTGESLEAMAREARARGRAYRRQSLLRAVFGAIAFGLALGMLAVLWLLPGVWIGMRLALLLWGAAMVACIAGLWPLRGAADGAGDVPLQARLQACLRRLQREVAYHRSLRWRFWLPFGLGLACALVPRVSPQPGVSWLFVSGGLLFCVWGFVQGPRHWPERLRAEEAALRGMLDGMQAAGGGETPV